MRERLEVLLTRRLLPVVLVVLSLALCLPSLNTGWQQDDLNHRLILLGHEDPMGKTVSPFNLFDFLDGDAAYTRALIDRGALPWWTLETLRLSFWRPLASLSHWLDYRLWPHSGLLQHAHNLLWFGLIISLAVLLYRRLLGNIWTAGLAGLFYALDDAHGLPAGWLANRNALLAVSFGLLAIHVHDRWRRSGWKPGALLGPACLSLGLLSAEAALGACAYLFAYACFIESGDKWKRLRTLLPYALVAGVWMAYYSIEGYGARGSAFYVHPGDNPLGFMIALGERIPILLLDQWAFPPSAIYAFLSEKAVLAHWILSVGFLGLLISMLFPLLKNDRFARFWAAGMVLSLLSICATAPHSRLLFFVGLGAFGLLAMWLTGRSESAVWVPSSRMWRMAAKIITVIFIVVHIILAPLLLPLNTLMAASVEPHVQGASETLPLEAEIVDLDFILVNPTYALFPIYIPAVRLLNAQPIPRRVRILAPGAAAVRITRKDAHTLSIRAEYLATLLDGVFRDTSYPFAQGERIDLSGMSITITDVTSGGRPLEASFTFAVPLEDPSLRWFEARSGGGFNSFTPPAIGDTISLPAVEF